MQNDALSPETQKEIWLQEIKENEAIQKYLSKYNEGSVESFITEYLDKKMHWLENGERYLSEKNGDSVQWVQAGKHHLKIILQKKLFDLQCRWRAEQVEIPGLRLSNAFKVWEMDILNCPFLEMITQEELDLYIDYLNDPFANRDDEENTLLGRIEWQDYDELKLALNNSKGANMNFPEWYTYVNMRTGAGSLMLLPDIRGEKERRYVQAVRAYNEKKNEERPAKPKWKPSIYAFDPKDLDPFVEAFETNEMKEIFRIDSFKIKLRERKEQLDYAITLLMEADEKVAMNANDDWFKAIELTAERYERKKVAEALPQAWEQYKMNKELGIGFANRRDHSFLIEIQTETILQGRQLLGEPEDLNF